MSSPLIVTAKFENGLYRCPVCGRSVQYLPNSKSLQTHFQLNDSKTLCSSRRKVVLLARPQTMKTIDKAGRVVGQSNPKGGKATSRSNKRRKNHPRVSKQDIASGRVPAAALPYLLDVSDAGKTDNSGSIHHGSSTTSKRKKRQNRSKSYERAYAPRRRKSWREEYPIFAEDSWGNDYLGPEGGETSVRASRGGRFEGSRSKH